MPEVLQNRKDSHLKICLEEEVEFSSSDASGFDSYRFDHDALPEIDKKKISTEVQILGKTLAAPLIIGAMTGGSEKAAAVNARLAQVAEKCQIGFALGSQRVMLSNADFISSYQVRQSAPGIPLLFGNIGAVQLNYGLDVEQIEKLISDVNADAFNFHLNPLQEAIQPEGDVDFSGLLEKLKKIIPQISVPVFLKEVGCGISERTALKIKSIDPAGVETAGLGGTSWSFIESKRTANTIQKNVGELFSQWGIPTSESIENCKSVLPGKIIIASGGIRNGVQVAKSIALGANAGACALPVLKAAEKSVDEAVLMVHQIIEELKTVMFLVGAKNISELQTVALRRTRSFL